MKLYQYGLLAVALSLTACGGESINLSGKPVDGGTPTNPIAPTAELKVARTSSPHADVLVKCVKAQTRGDSCSLNELSFIYSETPNPTIDDIMNRLVVSDDWMINRFQDMLTNNNMPKTILPLFQSVRAIVISSDVRPSYFTPYSGAIYLDPDYLWLTNAEKATINQDDDYRAAYAKKFQFLTTGRFVYNNKTISSPGSLSDKTERSLASALPEFTGLLFHELAHARDIFHNTFISTLTPSDKKLSEIYHDRAIPQMSNQVFVNNYTLTNSDMQAISLNLFGGEESKDKAQQAKIEAYTAAEVGFLLEQEGANDQYAYYKTEEDFAMLFEESMMKKHFNIDRDVAYLEVPDITDPKCDDYIIGWGQRNRIAASLVRPRALAVVKKALANATGPELLAVEDFFNSLGSPTTLPLIGYCSAINPNSRSLSNSDYDPMRDIIRY
ncbi:hypothetical protein K6Y31_03615 [Motilimonas cestriensis]|uniref:Lipoprotein n=1 Tax=Motilimonas cestriensis TaxID=2742685 RepID=A0ABS8W7W2_9GAMM|nr:hypothetical protein [Motilimonas cestriensis]MCE2593899.1 hypothetical protein [Motilimonas cestriensis]